MVKFNQKTSQSFYKVPRVCGVCEIWLKRHASSLVRTGHHKAMKVKSYLIENAEQTQANREKQKFIIASF